VIARQLMPSLNLQILLAALLGLALGFGLQSLPGDNAVRIQGLYWANLLGGIFIDLLKMVLVPLIFTSIVVGVANLQAHRQASRVWKLTLAFFLASMVLAMVLALVGTHWLNPGAHLQLAMFDHALQDFHTHQLTPGEFAQQFVHSLFQNPFAALAQGSILPVVVFALFLGVALVAGGARNQHLLKVLQEFLALLMRMVGWIMWLAPLGILALLSKLLATQNASLLASMGEFILLIFALTLIHGALILPGLLYLFTRKSPLWFWRGARPALITAFATSSSSATLPISLECAEHKLQVRQDVAGFVLPLGATMNMDGTALYEASAALFVATLAGIDLSFGQQLMVMMTAMVAAMGAPGIPSAGMVTMVMVLQAVGLPAEAIAILLPIDRLLDTIRTAVNVEGDLVASLVVDQALPHEA